MGYRQLTHSLAEWIATGQVRRPGDPEGAGRSGMRLAGERWCPPADVYETDRAITVMIELAGVGLEDLEVLLLADVLALQGVRRLPPEDRGRLYHAAQIQQGPFRLEVRLPAAIHAHSVETRYERGLLHLILPKLAEGRRHRR